MKNVNLEDLIEIKFKRITGKGKLSGRFLVNQLEIGEIVKFISQRPYLNRKPRKKKN
jgi:hypothetical protein